MKKPLDAVFAKAEAAYWDTLKKALGTNPAKVCLK